MVTRIIQVGLGVRGDIWSRIIREHDRVKVVGYVDLPLDVAKQKALSWNQSEVPCFSDLNDALESVESEGVSYFSVFFQFTFSLSFIYFKLYTHL